MPGRIDLQECFNAEWYSGTHEKRNKIQKQFYIFLILRLRGVSSALAFAEFRALFRIFALPLLLFYSEVCFHSVIYFLLVPFVAKRLTGCHSCWWWCRHFRYLFLCQGTTANEIKMEKLRNKSASHLQDSRNNKESAFQFDLVNNAKNACSNLWKTSSLSIRSLIFFHLWFWFEMCSPIFTRSISRCAMFSVLTKSDNVLRYRKWQTSPSPPLTLPPP